MASLYDRRPTRHRVVEVEPDPLWTTNPLVWPVNDPGPKVFKIMRIIGSYIVDVPGMGKCWIMYDLKMERSWARKYEPEGT